MIRLFLGWAVITFVIFFVKYLTDLKMKRELGKYSLRVLWSGLLSAFIIGFVVYLERF